MNIMHYSLGLPPFRTGGMIKYCMDLMVEEIKLGHNVYLLWPGRLKDFSEKMEIKVHKDYKINEENVLIHNIEIINPLPVPLLNGIKEFKEYMNTKNTDDMYKFLKNKEIDILHVHTLMGLPVEIIKICKELNIKTIFTTHDYFGICPKWGLEKNGIACSNDRECKDCVKCNKNALSLNKIMFLQSNVYKFLKDSIFLKILRRRNNSKLYIEDENSDVNEDISLSEKYKELRTYYMKILEAFDVIHYNSCNTQMIYSKYIENTSSGMVINISHGSIKEKKKIKKITDSIVKIGYLGPITKHKGFFFLKNVCEKIYCENKNFELHIFAQYNQELPYLKIHKPYKYNELEKVMEEFDILVVPSLWNETFGFTVLEALSFGKPVIVTNNVGSKDLIVQEKNGFIVECDEYKLEMKLKEIINNPQKIENMNNYIVNNISIKTMEEHVKEILDLYLLKTN
ncbi:MAG: glycosyltransferase [Clostridia bacterium]|nr:glycosyltransferase [Clostridia bacterium]